MATPRAKPPLALLLTAAKREQGLDWLTIEIALDLRRSTREAWMNGSTVRLPYVDLMRLCTHLGLTAEECFEAVIEHRLPEKWERWYVERDGAVPPMTEPGDAPITTRRRQPRV